MFPLFQTWINRKFSDPQMVILGFLLTLGFLLFFLFGEMLLPVFAGIVIAYVLEGIVARLQRFRVPRLAAVIIVFIGFLSVVLIITVGMLPVLSSQIGQLLQQLPSMLAGGQKQLMHLPERYPDYVSEEQVRHILGTINTGLTAMAQRLLSLSMASVRGVITALVYLILVPLMVFFFLKDKEKMLAWIMMLLPDNRGLATAVWSEVNAQIANYIRGKIWEILILGGISFATFRLLGMKFTMLVSIMVGLSVLVPYVGVTVVYFPVALFAYFQWGWSAECLYAVIAYGVIQLFDGNLLAPLLLSEVVNLHPIAIIVAVLVFGGLWGVWGLFFAIPLATLAHAVIKVWLNARAEQTTAQEAIDA
ncbi:MAG: AI-2E family transporter [Pseudomonadota bacterium]